MRTYFFKSFDPIIDVTWVCVKFDPNIRIIYKSLTVIKCAKLILRIRILL